VIDGRLDDAVWAGITGTSDFTQRIPYGGARPSERTTLKVAYDDDAIYFAFDCPQTATPIARRLTRRDRDSESDWVWVQIDSRRDARTSFFFAVNVSGVLADGAMSETLSASGFEWDENWEAESAITAGGWSAELRIPLRVLRFTEDLPVQSWGLWASRYIANRQEQDDWPYIPREIAAPIPFFGRLDELRDLPRGGRLELRPFALGKLRRRDANPALVESGFDADASAGLDLKLHLTQSLTLDAAVNPDFAQVEADQLVFNPNNYEILYPEKRPLFLEGAEAFATPLSLFYSRRIGSSPVTPRQRSGMGGPLPTEGRLVDFPEPATIYGAGKLVGRARDAWTIGGLAALAGRNDYFVEQIGGQPQRRTVEPLTAYSVLRLRRELGNRAYLGVIGTGTNRFEDAAGVRTCPAGLEVAAGVRCFRDGYAAGADGYWRSPGTNYLVSGQVVGTAVRGGLAEQQADGTLVGSGDRGIGGWLRLAKDGGPNVLADLTYTGAGRRLMFNDLGFMPRQNLHEGKVGLELRTLAPGALTLERRARLELSARRSLDGLDLGTLAELLVGTRLKGFWSLLGAANLAPAHFDDRETGDGSALERASYAGGRVEIASDPRKLLYWTLKGDARFLRGGFATHVESTLAFRTLPQLEIEVAPRFVHESGEPRYAWNATMPDGQYVFGRLLARSFDLTMHASYTFLPRLSLQAYAQLFLVSGHYSDFSTYPRPAMPGDARARIRPQDLVPLATAPADADFEQAALNVNVVLRWEYRLGSTLFLVYSRSQIPDVTLAAGESAGLRLGDVGRVPAIDVFLVKLSFWWAT
jgi:hypothetical protein